MPVPTGYDTELYTLGRGILYLAAWVGSTPPSLGDFRDVGNAPDVSIEPTEEVLDHFSSRSGRRSKDKQVTLESGATVLFSIDTVDVPNFQLFLAGTLHANGHKIHINMAPNTEWAVRFISDNADGQNYRLEIWKCKIRAAGAYGFISDEFATMAYTAEVLDDSTNHATSTFGDLTFVTTTTTTTTAP